MIFSLLKGRIGNIMFQIAAGKSLAVRLNTQFYGVISDIMLPEPDNCCLKEYLQQFNGNLLRNVDFIYEIPKSIRIISENDLFDSFTSLKHDTDIMIDGYFQSTGYFDEKCIRQMFSIDPKSYQYIVNRYGSLISKEPVSINVRRGDFVKQPHLHPVVSLKYLRQAINYFGDSRNFIVISDDIEWCKTKFRGENFFFIEDEPPVIDLFLQSLSRDNIITNSTFSWWGAWLNTNLEKTVIAPSENWIGVLHDFKISPDFLPHSWIKYPNPLTFMNKIKVAYEVSKYYGVKMKKAFR